MLNAFLVKLFKNVNLTFLWNASHRVLNVILIHSNVSKINPKSEQNG